MKTNRVETERVVSASGATGDAAPAEGPRPRNERTDERGDDPPSNGIPPNVEPASDPATGDAPGSDALGSDALGSDAPGSDAPGSDALGSEGSRNRPERKRRDMPGNLWMQCDGCSKLIYKPKVQEKLWVCPECNHHFEISSWKRLELMLDPGSFREHFVEISPLDPLEFRALKAYKDRLFEAQLKTGLKDACVVGTGTMEDIPVVFGVSDSRFLRGSMGSVVGEKIARATELANERGIPFVFVSGSGGGARMDEGILSLMQMAKTSAALGQLQRSSGLFISILTNPTMGGAMASFAALGDVILAEPKALIGFAGPNVIRQTIRSEIPEGFQTSEFLLQHGFIDKIVNREDLRSTVVYFLRMLGTR